MKDAFQLLEAYNAKKTAKVPLSKELAPLFGQLANLLERIAEKELPAPSINNEIQPAEVEVKLENPIEVNVPRIEVPAPIINNENYDYTSLFIELKRSVDKLAQVIGERPGRWKAVRNSQGFIDYIDGIEKDE